MVDSDSLDLTRVMAHLCERRPVFHSEADFQFAFAQSAVDLHPAADVRLEARPAPPRAEYVDLVCAMAGRRTFIELKYPTAGWEGTDVRGEHFALRHHSAYDLARRYFIHDVARLERFVVEEPGSDGVAILLTNEPSLWSEPGPRGTRDVNFRIHEGNTLSGDLVWGKGDATRFDQHLRGTYTARWVDYSNLGGPKGRFRWLAFTVPSSSRPTT